MRVIFMGTPDFAVGTLEALVGAGHHVCLVVTQPDKSKGRGRELQFTPVKEAAIRHEIPVFQPPKVREPQCVERLRDCQADVIVVVAFGQILPKEILDLTPYGCINVHASLLPKYRGAAPVQWAILSGEEMTGVTTMQMDEGIDTGDMILKSQVPIEAEETGESLHHKLAELGASLCLDTLELLKKGSVVLEPQGETPTPYAKMLDKKMGDIDWNRSALEIERLIRGLNSWPSAYTHWGERVLKIWRAKARSEKQPSTKGVPGAILSVGQGEFMVQTGDGVLEVREVQLAGKKRMSTEEFLRGYTFEKEVLFH